MKFAPEKSLVQFRRFSIVTFDAGQKNSSTDNCHFVIIMNSGGKRKLRAVLKCCSPLLDPVVRRWRVDVRLNECVEVKIDQSAANDD